MYNLSYISSSEVTFLQEKNILCLKTKRSKWYVYFSKNHKSELLHKMPQKEKQLVQKSFVLQIFLPIQNNCLIV